MEDYPHRALAVSLAVYRLVMEGKDKVKGCLSFMLVLDEPRRTLTRELNEQSSLNELCGKIREIRISPNENLGCWCHGWHQQGSLRMDAHRTRPERMMNLGEKFVISQSSRSVSEGKSCRAVPA
jgi:hypothetical protein